MVGTLDGSTEAVPLAETVVWSWYPLTICATSRKMGESSEERDRHALAGPQPLEGAQAQEGDPCEQRQPDAEPEWPERPAADPDPLREPTEWTALDQRELESRGGHLGDWHYGVAAARPTCTRRRHTP
jgi:hypothetical protein